MTLPLSIAIGPLLLRLIGLPAPKTRAKPFAKSLTDSHKSKTDRIKQFAICQRQQEALAGIFLGNFRNR